MSLHCMYLLREHCRSSFYTLSLHDALPILRVGHGRVHVAVVAHDRREAGVRVAVRRDDHAALVRDRAGAGDADRSEEHTYELQSPCSLVCRLLLEKIKEMMKEHC